MNTHVTVSDVHHGVTNTHTMVSDIHRTMVKTQECIDNQRRSVSNFSPPFHHQMNDPRYPDSSQVSYLNYRWI